MINICAFIGEPLQFGKIKLYPPKLKDVFADPSYNYYVKTLTLEQEDVMEAYGEKDEYPTPFEFLLINCYHDQRSKFITEEAFSFFCKESVEFDYENKKIFLIKSDAYLTAENFFDFQNAIRMICGMGKVEPPLPDDPNEDPRIKRIKEKARLRDRIKRKKGNKASGGISLETCVVALCCMGIGLTPMNIGEMSYVAFSPKLKMMQEKEKYDIDIRSLMAGASPKKVKPKYWIADEK